MINLEEGKHHVPVISSETDKRESCTNNNLIKKKKFVCGEHTGIKKKFKLEEIISLSLNSLRYQQWAALTTTK